MMVSECYVIIGKKCTQKVLRFWAYVKQGGWRMDRLRWYRLRRILARLTRKATWPKLIKL